MHIRDLFTARHSGLNLLWQWVIVFPAMLLFTVLSVPTASAHHSPARFDMSQTLVVEGELVDVKWANPHVYLVVKELTEQGETITWDVETVGPSALRRLGWTQDDFIEGSRLSLRGNPSRSGAPSLNLVSLQAADKTLNLLSLIREYTSPGEKPASGAMSLDGTWAVLPNFKLIGPYLPNGPKPALTSAGAAALAGFDENTMLPALQCIPYPSPYFMFILDVKQIGSSADSIQIRGDNEGVLRTIHMNMNDHAGAAPSIQGHSIGHWEGQTLVIDTTHFAAHAMGHAFGVPSGTSKHLSERLTLNTDGTRIAYHFEVSDPEFLAEPLSGDVEWSYRPELELSQASCDLQAAQRFTEE